MQQLAAAAGYAYKTAPDDPYTWDAHAVRGCACDEGFHGHNCLLRYCPLGDDPLTTHTVESIECSGRGLCDQSLGTCACFEQFGASDGKGGKGVLEDCGYVLPLILGVA